MASGLSDPSRASNGPLPMKRSMSEPEKPSPLAERLPRNSTKSPKSMAMSSKAKEEAASDSLMFTVSSPTTRLRSTAAPVVLIPPPIRAEAPVPPSPESPAATRPASCATTPWFASLLMKTMAPEAFTKPSGRSSETAIRTLLAAIESASTRAEVGVKRT